MSTETPYVKQSPQEYLQRQSAESVQANQKMEVLDKIRTSNMIFRGQKQLQQLVELKNRLLFGSKEVDAVPLPDDTIQFDCKTEHHHHAIPPVSPISSLLKIGLGAAAIGTGIGVPFALPSILSGIGEMMNLPGVVQQSVEPKPDAPVVNIGGKEYELSLEPE